MTTKQRRAWKAILVICLLAAPATAQQKPAHDSADRKPLQTIKDKESYAMGVEMLRNLKRQGFDFDLELVIRGMKDAASGGKIALSDEEMLESLNLSASEARVRKTSDQLIAGEDNKKAEEDFVAVNRTKNGVVTLPSGLQYEIIKEAEGKKPLAQDAVQVNYRAILLDGTQVDSTYEKGEATTLNVSDRHLIPGLREALRLMPVGSHWKLFIPSRLAYGQRSAGTLIGPYAMLIYDVELLAIK